MIQEEWEESLRQMEVVLSIIIMPFFGKWYGRRWAYWGECQCPIRVPAPSAQCPELHDALCALSGCYW